MNKTISTIHFVYALIASFFLISASLITARQNGSLLTPLLFIPLVLHFTITIYEKIYNSTYRANQDEIEEFNLMLFLTQDNSLFLITIGLFLLAFSITIIKGLLTG